MIHVLFSSSAAGTLRQVLRSRDRDEWVVDLTENLDWGLINSSDPQQRVDWLDSNVPSVFEGGWDGIVEQVDDFAYLVDQDDDRTIWIEPRSASEISGLHWYLDRFGASDAHMLIAPEFEWFRSLGTRDFEAMVELLDHCPRVPWDQARFPKRLWATLEAENSVLRVIINGVLQSVPNDYFDRYILERCSSAWTEWMRVVGNSMVDIDDAGHRVSDLFLRWRVGELIKSGIVVVDGKLPLYGEQAKALIKLAD